MMKQFCPIISREWLIARHNRAQWVNPLLFFVIVITLFPMAVNPQPTLLASIGPGVIWVAALLSVLLSLEHLFSSDFSDGSLDQLLLSVPSSASLVLGKVTAHWLITCVPLLFITPLAALMYGIDAHVLVVLMLSLLLGTPILSLVGAIGVALTVGLHRGGILIAIIVLPLYVPVLIFGCLAALAAGMGFAVAGHLALLAALFIVALVFCPYAAGGALRVAARQV